ncbi:glycosyltransferase family 2 protein [Halanaerobium congolense]|uniref:glycosyltransferase family 2 protein n=1 Tax=Halanaerobium congolense TaxID=54121 RepID=UPI00105B7983|nr:glycosyltransferase [Halanaerobium congolense]TDP11584.1 glycosyltransferase involved in cell wall biosynthesis [Halanaerobium congolense]
MFFSVIVPAYNVENEIKRCINSIINQSFKEFELIIINDGSTDNTGKICDELSKKEEKIQIIHQENKGLSFTRNVGMSVANGKYLVFIDSDDYIEENSLFEFHSTIIKNSFPDVLITRLKQVFSDTVKYMDKELSLIKLYDEYDYIEWIFSKSKNTWPSQRYVVKNKLVREASLKFIEGYLHEDIDWTFNLFIEAQSFATCNYYWYNHLQDRKASITNNISAQNIIDVIKIVKFNIDKIEELDMNIKIKKIMRLSLVNTLYAILSYFPESNEKEKKQIINLLKNNKNIFEHAKDIRHKLFNICSYIFGFRVSLFIMDLIHSNKE